MPAANFGFLWTTTMVRIELGIPCPKCGKELCIEGGLTPELLREAIRMQTAGGGVSIECRDCGSETVVGGPVRSETKPSRILIVEDHPIVRTSFANLISGESDLEVVASCDTAGEAIRLVTEHRPDLVLIDIALKESNGLGLCQQLAASHPELPMLILSGYDETLYAERALRAGARGFVGKGADAEELLAAIRSVLAGNVWLSERMRERASADQLGAAPWRSSMSELSDRELEVFELIGHGLTSAQVAERLRLSTKTVESHRANLKRKLGLETLHELTRTATEWVLRK